MDKNDVVLATELTGRPVIDLGAAEKVGRVDAIVVDPDARRVAALLVGRGQAVAGEPMHMTVPAASVHAIGPDAVTMRRDPAATDVALTRLGQLPRASDLIGRKVITEDGRLLGRVDDVLIGREDGRILGYTLGHTDVLGKIEGIFRGDRKEHTPYLRADADLKAGHDLIVAPEGAVSQQWDASEETTRGSQGWQDYPPPSSAASPWMRRDPA